MKNSEYILRAMNDIDDKFIEEAMFEKKRKERKIISFPVMTTRLAFAAAAAILVLIGINVFTDSQNKTQEVQMTEDTTLKSNDYAPIVEGLDEAARNDEMLAEDEAQPPASIDFNANYPSSVLDYNAVDVIRGADLIDVIYENNSLQTISLRIIDTANKDEFGDYTVYSNIQVIDGAEYRGEGDTVSIVIWQTEEKEFHLYPERQSLENTQKLVEAIREYYN